MKPRGVRLNVPWTLSSTSCPSSSPYQNGVAGADLHSRLFLPRIQILGKNLPASLQITNPQQARHVHQHSSRKNPVRHLLHTQLSGTCARHLFLSKAVVHPALVEQVAQRIQVRLRV